MSKLKYLPDKMTWQFYQEYSKHMNSSYKFGISDTTQPVILTNEWLEYNKEFLKEWNNGRGNESTGNDSEIDG